MNLWESYKTSIFLCHQTLNCDIDFAIISAQNPAGHLYHPQHNLTLDREFETELDEAHIPYRTIIGASPDLSFQEKSWAVLCDKTKALSLALKFRQNAIYWVEQGQLYLVPVLLPEQEECLGQFQQRLVLLPA